MALTNEEIKQRHTEGRFVFQLNLEQIKELQQEGFAIIATHGGTPHADDVFACVAFKLNLELGGKKAIIVRTKDQAIVEIADVVVDTGKIYDPEKNRFDHHQEGGAGERPENSKYASFGLVWEKIGVELVKNYLVGKGCPIKGNENFIIANILDNTLVSSIDAYDTGGEVDHSVFDYGSLLSSLRPTFFEKETKTAKRDDAVFEEFAGMSTLFLKRHIAHCYSEDILFDRMKYSEEINDQIMILDFAVRMSEISKFLESRFTHIDVVIINQDPKKGGMWTVNIPKTSKAKFPPDWLGKSGDAFAHACGLPDVDFCHVEGFTLTCKSKESAILLANEALVNTGAIK